MNEELHKHRCCVRDLLAMKHKQGHEAFKEYVHGKGKGIWMKCQKDFVTQWRLGNRGVWGVWL